MVGQRRIKKSNKKRTSFPNLMLAQTSFSNRNLPKMSVVLDLDETLVHANFCPPKRYDFTIDVPCDGQTITVYIQKRPGVDEFIRTVAREFDVFIYTASHISYALPVMQSILPCFPAERILWRGHCRLVKGFIVKDLSIFNRDLARVVLVDNSPQSFLLQPQNGIPISTWVGDYSDMALMDQLLPFLRYCGSVDDVRSVITPAVQ
jgi:RNA polymerase II subunit A small phosphatase-like protein